MREHDGSITIALFKNILCHCHIDVYVNSYVSEFRVTYNRIFSNVKNCVSVSERNILKTSLMALLPQPNVLYSCIKCLTDTLLKYRLLSRPNKKKNHSDTETSKPDQDIQELEARKAELELENEQLTKEIESLKMGQKTSGNRKSPVDEIDAAQQQQLQTDPVSPEIESESKDTKTG